MHGSMHLTLATMTLTILFATTFIPVNTILFQDWPEITRYLHTGQTGFDRAQLVSRVFKQTLDVLLQVRHCVFHLLQTTQGQCFHYASCIIGTSMNFRKDTTIVFVFPGNAQVLPDVFGKIVYRIAVIEFQVKSIATFDSCIFRNIGKPGSILSLNEKKKNYSLDNVKQKCTGPTFSPITVFCLPRSSLPFLSFPPYHRSGGFRTAMSALQVRHLHVLRFSTLSISLYHIPHTIVVCAHTRAFSSLNPSVFRRHINTSVTISPANTAFFNCSACSMR